jgi:hypothetical protein
VPHSTRSVCPRSNSRRTTRLSGNNGMLSEPAGTGMLRQRTAEMGGNVLLVRPGGLGEAWDCAGRFHAYAPATQPSPTRPVTGRYPTPPATPRY